MTPKKNILRFAYLNLQGNPRGNAMLHRIIEEGHEPLLVIEEDSSLAKKNELSLASELKWLEPDIPLPPSLLEIVQEKSIRCVRVANHNDEHTQNFLKELSPNLIVLGDTRIIKPHIIEIPSIGIINVHPGYLPDVRGNNPYVWALYHDLPQGCSVHFIDKDIDTGPLILREKMELEQGASFPFLMHTLINSCANLLATALNRIEKGNMECQQQADLELMGSAYPTFPLAPPAIKERAKQILSEGSYKFFIKQ